METAAAARASHESSVVIESGAEIALQLTCVREKLTAERSETVALERYTAAVMVGHDIEKKLRELAEETIWGLLCISGNQQRDLEVETARYNAALEAERKTALEYAMAVSDAVCGHAVSAAGLESSVVREIVAMNRRLVEYERTAEATYGLVAEISGARRLANRLTEELALERQVAFGTNSPKAECQAAELLGKKDSEEGARRRSFNAICRAVLGSPKAGRPDLETAYNTAYDDAVEWRDQDDIAGSTWHWLLNGLSGEWVRQVESQKYRPTIGGKVVPWKMVETT